MSRFVRDALISIAFFQVILTPYLFFWLELGWAQYGKWNAANIVVSAIAGPVLVRAMGWFDQPEPLEGGGPKP